MEIFSSSGATWGTNRPFRPDFLAFKLPAAIRNCINRVMGSTQKMANGLKGIEFIMSTQAHNIMERVCFMPRFDKIQLGNGKLWSR